MRVILAAGKNLLDDILMNENGTLERISEERAIELLSTGFISGSWIAANCGPFESTPKIGR